MSYLIEKNVPYSAVEISKYPFAQMEVGDSFLVPIKDASPSCIRTSSAQFQRNHPGFRFSIRISKKEGGTRVWRVPSRKAQTEHPGATEPLAGGERP